ncbi:MAG: TetR/AcrR family transcriptional regulator [Thermodesulfobacteriota bacterium]|nr:TetR/AcrR family transcriptional regulator [Thermodesulfobacteriota bacterium]
MFKQLREKEIEMRQQLIVQKAEEIFQQEGHEAVTIRNVAEKVGVSPGTIYTYFKDKDEVLLHVLINNLELLENNMQASLHIDDPMECLESLAQNYKNYYLRFGRYTDILSYLSKADDDAVSECFRKKLKAVIAKIFTGLEKRLEADDMAAIRKGLTPERTAVVLWAAIQGASQVTLPSANGQDRLDWLQFDHMLHDMIHVATGTAAVQ